MHTVRFSLLVGGLVAGLAVLPCARAQDAPSPESGSGQSAGGSTSGTATTTDLFPGNGTPSSGGNHHNGGGHQRNGRRHDLLVSQADTDPLALRVAFRRAETVAVARDPGLAALLAKSDAASTDPEKRAYLKQYYTRLFASVCKIDPDPAMKAHVDLLTAVAEQRYDPKRREVGGDEDVVNGRGGGRRGRIQ